jgi:hypothetical protein
MKFCDLGTVLIAPSHATFLLSGLTHPNPVVGGAKVAEISPVASDLVQPIAPRGGFTDLEDCISHVFHKKHRRQDGTVHLKAFRQQQAAC